MPGIDTIITDLALRIATWAQVTSGTTGQNTPIATNEWTGWPFNVTDYRGAILPIIAKFVFVALLLGTIALVIRKLFGPGGPMRPDWADEENARAAAREKAEKEQAEKEQAEKEQAEKEQAEKERENRRGPQ